MVVISLRKRQTSFSLYIPVSKTSTRIYWQREVFEQQICDVVLTDEPVKATSQNCWLTPPQPPNGISTHTYNAHTYFHALVSGVFLRCAVQVSFIHTRCMFVFCYASPFHVCSLKRIWDKFLMCNLSLLDTGKNGFYPKSQPKGTRWIARNTSLILFIEHSLHYDLHSGKRIYIYLHTHETACHTIRICLPLIKHKWSIICFPHANSICQFRPTINTSTINWLQREEFEQQSSKGNLTGEPVNTPLQHCWFNPRPNPQIKLILLLIWLVASYSSLFSPYSTSEWHVVGELRTASFRNRQLH